MRFLDWITPALGVFGWRGRRTHVVNGRAHVELRTMTAEQHREFVARLSEAMKKLEGVLGMATIPLVGRAIVAFDADRCDVRDIVALVERTEAECGVEHAAPFPTEWAEHPGDLEPLLRCLIELAGDVLGLATALTGQLSPARVLPIEIDALAVLAFFDVPRLRAFLDERLGRQATNLSLTLGTSFLQGLAQSPLGPLVDIVYRTLVVGERVAGRRAWAAREPMLCGSGIGPPPDHEPPPSPRPRPLPAGPIEKYADAALFASLGAFGLGLASSGSVVNATSTLFGGLPKPARLGREAFAAYLGRQLALRGIVVFDADVLRRLDRVDCLVLEATLALRGERVLDDVVVLDAGVDIEEVHRQMAVLFDPGNPEAPRQRGEWALAPLEIQNGNPTPRVEAWLRRPRAPCSRLHALRRGDTLVAIAESRVLPDPDAEILLATARRAGMRIVIAGDGVELPKDETVPGGHALPEAIRRLQVEGRVVCVVANRAARGLAAADCGVGITLPGEPPPFGAQLLGGSSLDDAAFVVDACIAAREVASQSATLAAAGAGAGLFLSFGGLSRQTPGRVMTAVNIATIVTMANGVRVSAGLWFRPIPQHRDMTPWHGLDIENVLARLSTSVSGLPSAEALRRLRLPAAPPTRLVALGRAVVEQLQTPLTPLLAVGAGLSALVGSLSDAGLILGVLGLNALIGGVQAVRTESAITRLGATNARRTCVRRDGREVLIDPAHVVPGDVVVLRGGDPVPADCRVIEAAGLEADESCLTGESLPVAKAAEPCFASAVAERRSMLYEGTSVAAGEALGVVVAVGEQTEARHGAHVAGAREPAVGVEARLDSLTSFMMPVSVVGGALAGIAGAVAGRPLRDVLATGVSLTVAAVPEGLPMLATVAQLGAARRLARRGVLVRHPRAIEALGRANVLCVDKTGTLTEGRIRLHAVSLGDGERAVGTLGAQERRVVGAGLRATPEVVANHKLSHPTDRALVEGAARTEVAIEDDAVGWRRLAEIPFEPARGFHAVLGRTNGELLMNAKGAPEVILARCQTWARPDGVSPLDPVASERLAQEADRLARKGLRVLAVAEKHLVLDAAFDEAAVSELTFLGFLAFSDHVRPSAAAAIAGLQQAGVDVVMITGDHPATATEIAAQLGLINHAGVVTGVELDEMNDATLDARLPGVSVFARVTPSHKARIVRALQRGGRVVAMTGDGANDAVAIRLAEVGIALGAHAAPAAREAADLVVTDDRIETLVDAVLEGRAMWASVRDAVSVMVGGNLGEVLFTVGASMVVGGSPLNARQLLLVNLLTDVVPAMAIALRPPANVSPAALLREGPEASLGSALNRDIAWRAVVNTFGTSSGWLLALPISSRARASTVALISLVGTHLGQTFVAGGTNPLVLAAGLGSVATLVVCVQTPGVSQFFGCTPLGPLGWATATTAAVVTTGASIVIPRLFPLVESRVTDLARRAVDAGAPGLDWLAPLVASPPEVPA